jgi:cyclohexyl-isocyanide hydratase
MTAPFRVGFLLFPNITQLDLTGPWEVLARLPGREMHLIWKTLDPVRAESGLSILPTTTFADCPPLDLICVPGGNGMNPLLTDTETLDFIRRMAADAQWITSVCTGALVLGAAGLLRGKRATTHWMSHELLARFGAIPVAERVVVDGNVITGGGVTAGIDFGLQVIAQIHGREAAEAAQLGIEYDPHPPVDSGHPSRARPELVASLREKAATRQAERAAQVERAAAAL